MKKKWFMQAAMRSYRLKKMLTVMKLSVLLILLGTLTTFARGYAQDKNVNINFTKASFTDVINEIRQQTGLKFLYNLEKVSHKEVDNLKLENVSVEEAVKTVLDLFGFTYSVIEDVVVVNEGMAPQQKTETIQGEVKDKDGNPLPGVSVFIKGTTTGVSSDADGKFKFTIPSLEPVTLSFTFVGMKSKEVKYTGQKSLLIVLEQEVAEMEEVVVTGFFNKSKSSFTGAARMIGKDELRQASNQNLLTTVSMIDPSFKLMDNNLMGSDPNTMPDFTIRGGVSFDDMKSDTKGNPNMPLFVLDGFVVDVQQVYDLDPNRVEAITILKDATATALYGSRAANGVVVVETIRPQKGKLRLTYTGDLNLEVPDITDYNLLNASEKLEYEKVAGLFDEIGFPWYDEGKRNLYNERLKLVKQGYDTDWLNKPLNKLGVGHKHSVLMEGGDDHFTYALTMNYEDKSGVMKESGRKRLAISSKLQYRYKNLNFKNDLSFQRVKATNSPYGSFSAYVKMNPYYAYEDDHGNIKRILGYYTNVYGEPSETIANPLYNAHLKSIDENVTERITNNFQFDWKILEGMKLKVQFAVSKENGRTDLYKSDKHTDYDQYAGDDIFRKGEYTKTNSEALNYSLNGVYSYYKTFGDHLISFNAGVDIAEDNSEYLTYRVEGVAEAKANPSLALQFPDGSIPSGDDVTKRSIGFFGSLNYSWQNRFLVDGSYRTDASSIYGKNARWGGFWSVGLGWNMHREKFMEECRLVSLLKLRASTGIVGGQTFDAYESMRTYRLMTAQRYEDWTGVNLAGIDNPDLKWQKNHKTNVGMDFELFHSRLKGSFDYYWEMSQDNRINVNVAPSSGFSSYPDNLGSVLNRGLEIGLNYKYLDKGDWQGAVFGTAIRNVNKIKKITKELVAFNNKQDANAGNKPMVYYIENESFNTIWAVQSLGINPANGDELFRKRNGQMTSEWSTEDLIPAGCSDPKLEGTFGTFFRYKDFSLNAYFAFRLGADLYNETLVDKVENSSPQDNVDRRAFDQGWKKPGDVSFYRKPGNKETKATTRFIQKENYLKMGSLNLTYYLPVSFCRKICLKNAKFSVYMNDVFTVSSIKQERGISYPFARNYSASLQLTF